MTSEFPFIKLTAHFQVQDYFFYIFCDPACQRLSACLSWKLLVMSSQAFILLHTSYQHMCELTSLDWLLEAYYVLLSSSQWRGAITNVLFLCMQLFFISPEVQSSLLNYCISVFDSDKFKFSFRKLDKSLLSPFLKC